MILVTKFARQILNCLVLKKRSSDYNNVSVIKTDNINGKDSIAWAHPTELDTTQYSAPSDYVVYDISGNVLNQFPSANSLNNLPTNYTVSNINTTDTNGHYKIVPIPITVRIVYWVLALLQAVYI